MGNTQNYSGSRCDGWSTGEPTHENAFIVSSKSVGFRDNVIPFFAQGQHHCLLAKIAISVELYCVSEYRAVGFDQPQLRDQSLPFGSH
jgi:hypothetical protein